MNFEFICVGFQCILQKTCIKIIFRILKRTAFKINMVYVFQVMNISNSQELKMGLRLIINYLITTTKEK